MVITTIREVTLQVKLTPPWLPRFRNGEEVTGKLYLRGQPRQAKLGN
jgi:hypothetical protein